MKLLLPLALFVPLSSSAVAATLASYNFTTSPFLAPTTVGANVSASNVGIDQGSNPPSVPSSISTNVTTGSYFPNEPYIQGSQGWNQPTQNDAKSFTITITADPGFEFSLDSVFFRAYATEKGPSAIGIAVNSSNIFAMSIPLETLTVVNETVGQTGLTSATIYLQGWDNGSTATDGKGGFRLDDVLISGEVTAIIPEPTSALLASLGLLGLLRRRR